MDVTFSHVEGQKEEKSLPFLTKEALNKNPSPKNSFKKKEHLKGYSRIRSLFTSGKKISEFPVILLWEMPAKQDVPLLAGFSVPKRNFKKAVERNRIKRQMKEVYRKNKSVLSGLPGPATLMFIYVSSSEISKNDLQEKLLSCCRRLLSQVHETNK